MSIGYSGDWLDRKYGVDHLDFETKHIVSTYGYPSGGGTAYVARCDWCGDSICLRDKAYFKTRLAAFREEPCRRE